MKVMMTNDAKKIITLAEAPYARQIIEDLKEDTGLQDYARMAANVAGGNYGYEILKATAEITRNRNVWDQYGEGTGMLDVLLKIYAFSRYRGFYEIHVYLSDIWQIAADNTDEIRNRMWIEHYKCAEMHWRAHQHALNA